MWNLSFFKWWWRSEGGSGKEGTETHEILVPVVGEVFYEKLMECIERVEELGFRTDGDVKNMYVPRKAKEYLIETYGPTITSRNGIRYDVRDLEEYVSNTYFHLNQNLPQI